LRLALRNYDDKKIVITNGSDVGAMLRGGAAAPLMEHQVVAPVPHITARPQPRTVQVEILRDGHSSESISFVHGRGARNTEGLNQEMIGSADARFEMAGVENLTPAPGAAPPASAPPAGSVASTASGRHQADVQAPGGAGFSGAAEENPFFAGPNSKTVDVP
jgi:hypothetical protein